MFPSTQPLSSSQPGFRLLVRQVISRALENVVLSYPDEPVTVMLVDVNELYACIESTLFSLQQPALSQGP